MLGLSFTDWRISLDNLQFVGLENYQNLVADPIFWTSVGNTLYIVVGRVVLGTSFALLLAILLNQKVPGIPFFLRRLLSAHSDGGRWRWRWCGFGYSIRAWAS